MCRIGSDRIWAGDIPSIATDEGGLFLAIVIDLFSRQVVGGSLQETMTRGIVIDALRMAWFKTTSLYTSPLFPEVGCAVH